MNHSSITGNHFADSFLVTSGSILGSCYAVIASSDIAAITTLIGTVGTLLYQFARLFTEARRKSLEEAIHLRQVELDGSQRVQVLAAEGETRAAKIEATNLQERLDRSESEKGKLQRHLDRLFASLKPGG